MSEQRPWLRFTTLIAVVALVASACGAQTTPTPGVTPTAPAGTPTAVPTPAIKTGGTLVVALPSDINRTDPALIDDSNSSYVMQAVMESLVGLKPGTTGDLAPSLAKSWTVSADALTYTFTLQEGVKFHDGTDFNAAAVKFNYERWINLPDSYGDLEYTYYVDTVLGRGDTTIIESITTNGDYEVTIKLKRPFSPFLLTQTLVVFAISSPKALEDGKASDPVFENNKYATGGPPAMVGTGPFKFKSWTLGDRVEVEKFADYWNKAAGGPYLDGIVFRPISDSTATLNALEDGSIDFTQILAPTDANSAAQNPDLQNIDRGSSCNLLAVDMNQKHKPFDNLKIRQAVAYSINKQRIIDNLYAGQAVPGDNWMPPGTVTYKPLNLPTYNVDTAKQLIADSGVPEADLAFEYWYFPEARPYMPDPKGVAESVLADLEAAGFKPQPKTEPFRPDFLAHEAAGLFPIFQIGWTCDWQGPDNFLNTAFFGYRTRSDGTFGPNEEFEYKNDEMWAAMDKALTSSDAAEQLAEWQKVQDFLAADMPSVPLLSSKPPAAGAIYVKGFVPAGNLIEYFTNVWLDK